MEPQIVSITAHQPSIVVVGGANGAGKSTFARIFLSDNPEFVFLNADEIARELRPDNLYAARFDAGREFLRRLNDLRQQQTPILLESTLSGLTLVKQLTEFANSSYSIRVVYVFLNAATVSVGRVAARVLDGGHHVPTEDIIRRFSRSQRNFWFTYRNLANHWNLVSNTGDDFLEVADCEGQHLTLFDDEAFWRFVLPLDPSFLLS